MTSCGQKTAETSSWEELKEFYVNYSEIYEMDELFDIFEEETGAALGSIHPVINDLGSDAILLDLLDYRPDLVCTNLAHPISLNRITVGVSTLRDSSLTKFKGAIRFESHLPLVEFGRVRHRKTLDSDMIVAEEFNDEYRWFVDALASLPIPLLQRYFVEFRGKDSQPSPEQDIFSMLGGAILEDEGHDLTFDDIAAEVAALHRDLTVTKPLEDAINKHFPNPHNGAPAVAATVASVCHALGAISVLAPTDVDEITEGILSAYHDPSADYGSDETPADPRFGQFLERRLQLPSLQIAVIDSIQAGLPKDTDLSVRDIMEALGDVITEDSSEEEAAAIVAAFS